MSAITFDAIRYVDETIKNELATKGDIFEVKTSMATKDDLKNVEFKLEKRLNRLEILMAILLAVQAIPILKSLIN